MEFNNATWTYVIRIRATILGGDRTKNGARHGIAGHLGDPNGNQTIRHIGSDTFTLFYDAENRLVEVKKNSTTLAQFTFDGDGKRVKSVTDGETTLFVGAHYEVKNPSTGSGQVPGSGQQVTKYYFAGASRIALRKYTIPVSMSVEFMIGDHPFAALRASLGSTSITTDANGVKVSEMRYKACPLRCTPGVLCKGETRYSAAYPAAKRKDTWTNAPANTSPAHFASLIEKQDP